MIMVRDMTRIVAKGMGTGIDVSRNPIMSFVYCDDTKLHEYKYMLLDDIYRLKNVMYDRLSMHPSHEPPTKEKLR